MERSRAGRALRLAGLLVAVGLVYLGMTGLQVWGAGRLDERAPADAIVVLGAAQYDGRPSPVLAARLDHALALYQQGVAPYVVVTGGRRPGDRWTEASTAYNHLARRGVPDAALLRITEGSDTWQELAATDLALTERGLDRVVLVSSPSHALRTRVVAEELGLRAQVSPTRSDPADRGTDLGETAQETAAVAVGRLVGHRRLANLNRQLAGQPSGAEVGRLEPPDGVG